MNKVEKILLIALFGVLHGTAALTQSFSHIDMAGASPSDSHDDPFYNPDFSQQKALEYFKDMEEVVFACEIPITPHLLDELIEASPLNAHEQTELIHMVHDLWAGKYADDDIIFDQCHLAQFFWHAQAYAHMTAYGFENIKYTPPIAEFQHKKFCCLKDEFADAAEDEADDFDYPEPDDDAVPPEEPPVASYVAPIFKKYPI